MVDVLSLSALDTGLACFMAVGWHDGACERLQQLARIHQPEDLVGGLQALNEAEWTMAIDQLRRCADLQTEPSIRTTIWAWVARAWRGLGQLEMADEVIKSCLGLPGSDAAIVELAELQEQRGNRQGAIRTLGRERKRLIERHPPGSPDSADAYARHLVGFSLRMAQWALADGDWEAAQDHWNETRNQVATLAEAHLVEAGLLLQQGALQSAYAAIHRFSWLYRGQVLRDHPDWPDVSARLQAMPELEPFWSHPAYQQAIVTLVIAEPPDLGDGLLWQERLVAEMPDHPDALLALGRHHLEQRRPTLALAPLERADQLPCANPHVRAGIRQALQKAYARSPGRQQAALALGHDHTPDAAIAAQLLTRFAAESNWRAFDDLARQLGIEQQDALPTLLDVLAGRTDADVVPLLEHLAVSIPGHEGVLGELITRKLGHQDMAAVTDHLRALIRAHPGFETFARLARRLWQIGHRTAAEALLLQFAQSYPGSNAPYWTLAEWWSDDDSTASLDQASEHARQALRRSGPMAQNQQVLARLARHQGEAFKALQHYQSAMRQRPDDQPLLDEIGRFALALDYPDEAERVYQRLRQLTGSPGDGLLPLAHKLWQAGHHDRAAKLYLEADALGCIDRQGDVRITQWLLGRGDWAQATDRLGNCQEREDQTNQAVLSLLKARLALRLASPDEALGELEQAVANCQWISLLLPDDPTWDPLRQPGAFDKRFAELLG